MALTSSQYDPFRMLFDMPLYHRPSQFFLSAMDDGKYGKDLQPSYSFERDNTSARLEVELPGVSRDDTTLDLEGDKLVVTAKRFDDNRTSADADVEQAPEKAAGETKDEAADEKEAKDRKPSVVYKLAVRLAPKVDREAIRAEQRDGVLRVLMPFKTEERARRIEIGATN